MVNYMITQEDAANELYAHGKACLTAHREANIDKKYRPYLALFAEQMMAKKDLRIGVFL